METQNHGEPLTEVQTDAVVDESPMKAEREGDLQAVELKDKQYASGDIITDVVTAVRSSGSELHATSPPLMGSFTGNEVPNSKLISIAPLDSTMGTRKGTVKSENSPSRAVADAQEEGRMND